MAAAEKITLTVDAKRPAGTRPSKRLRAEGKIPAVVYGADTTPTAVSVAWSDLRAALITDAGLNALITIEIEGEEKLTIVKDMQRHPVRRDITHVDFIVIDRNKPIDVDVPVVLVDIDGDNLNGLVLDQVLFSVSISAKPGTIPNEFAISCAELSPDEPIRAGDIALPDGVELNIDPEDAVVIASMQQVDLPESGEGEEAETVATADEGGQAGDESEAAEASDDADGGDED